MGDIFYTLAGSIQKKPDMQKLTAIALFLLFSLSLYSQDSGTSLASLDGLWMGKMKVSEQMSLQIAFEIDLKDGGHYSAKMNVIEQRALDIPMDTCVFKKDSLYIELKEAGLNYQGVYTSVEDKIYGTFSQGGGVFSLDLVRVDKLPLEVERPQTPVRPFPYDEVEVKFENSEAGITLAGTLTKPSDGKNLPAVILIAGSGRNLRDGTNMGHFLLLSDFLTRNGYAVLRYDKRGVGESEGEYELATTFDFAADSRAALEYLKAHPDIDPQQIGLIGHSEGGLIAPIVASEYKDDVSFIVMMGGIGITGSELLLIQAEKMARIAGVPEEEIAKMEETNRKLYEIAGSDLNDSLMVNKCKEAVPEANDDMVNELTWDWLRTFLSLDPDLYISKVECPTLAITGEKDVQCPPEENLAAMKASLKKAGNKNFETRSMPGLNHLFQTAESGSPMEYEQIAEIISPDALKVILEWMNDQAKSK